MEIRGFIAPTITPLFVLPLVYCRLYAVRYAVHCTLTRFRACCVVGWLISLLCAYCVLLVVSYLLYVIVFVLCVHHIGREKS